MSGSLVCGCVRDLVGWVMMMVIFVELLMMSLHFMYSFDASCNLLFVYINAVHIL